MNFQMNINPQSNSFCTRQHPLIFAQGRNAKCDNCGKFGLYQSYACLSCNYDLCEFCAMKGLNIKTGGGLFGKIGNVFNKVGNMFENITSNNNSGVTMTTSTSSYTAIPTNKPVKLYDRNHSTFLFIGNQTQDNDHTAYGCKETGFQSQNFGPRTSFTIIPVNGGVYQIRDDDHQAYLFIGNSMDNGGDHTVYASPQKCWKDYNDFMFRTSFSIVPDQYGGGYRFLDKKHNSYIFVGNGNNGGDHTLYSVPVNKFNSNPNEWNKRTVFDIKENYSGSINTGYNNNMNTGYNPNIGINTNMNTGYNPNMGINTNMNTGYNPNMGMNTNMNTGYNPNMGMNTNMSTGYNPNMGMNTNMNMGMNTNMNMGYNTMDSSTTANNLIQRINNKPFANDKISELKLGVNGAMFYAKDACGIVKAFPFDGDQHKACVILYSHLIDPNNVMLMLDGLTFSMTRDKVLKELRLV